MQLLCFFRPTLTTCEEVSMSKPDECARIDATIRFCEPVEGENLCVRSSEVLAECQLNIDCGLGDECVDGSCVDASP